MMRIFNLITSQFDNSTIKKTLSTFLCLLITATAYCQTEQVQMADGFRSDGKIYVVVLVLSVVFACLATYLIIIDRKLKKLEEKNK